MRQILTRELVGRCSIAPSSRSYGERAGRGERLRPLAAILFRSAAQRLRERATAGGGLLLARRRRGHPGRISRAIVALHAGRILLGADLVVEPQGERDALARD